MFNLLLFADISTPRVFVINLIQMYVGGWMELVCNQSTWSSSRLSSSKEMVIIIIWLYT